MAGLYIHIPFCKQACHYCDFHFSTSSSYKPRMIASIIREIELKREMLHEEVHTIYFGGGTPSLLTKNELHDILNAIRDNYMLSTDLEITLEANPDDINSDFINTIVSSEVNRLSIGIQSFYETDLIYMNRAHNSAEAKKAIELCLDADIKNITADLIYGLPTLSHDNWKANVDQLIAYGIPHLSCYQLTVEDKTPLEAYIERGQLKPPKEEHGVEQFYLLLDKMAENKYEAYEISNYAKPGCRSRHNSAYWSGEAYLGFGPSAHSYFNNTRSWNTVVNNRYMEEIEAGHLVEMKEVLTPQNRYNEYVLTRLRTMEGIPTKTIDSTFKEFADHFHVMIKRPIEKKLLLQSNGNIVLTREGKIWADAISSELMV